MANRRLSRNVFLFKMKLLNGFGKEESDKAKQIADECSDVTDDDRCEAALAIWMCVDGELNASPRSFD